MRVGTAGTCIPLPPHFPAMKASTIALAFGAVLFALPIPGTFITGALILLAALVARYLGS